jgi:acyl-CoA thioester hydrolase
MGWEQDWGHGKQGSEEKPRELSGYAAIVTLTVQWGDQDAFGHVNNAVALRWFETSRIRLLEEHGLGYLIGGDPLVPLVTAISCRYRRQVTYPDTIRVGTRVAELGRSRMTLAHRVFSHAQQQIVAEGETTAVFFDRGAQRPIRIPAAVRTALPAPPTATPENAS